MNSFRILIYQNAIIVVEWWKHKISTYVCVYLFKQYCCVIKEVCSINIGHVIFSCLTMILLNCWKIFSCFRAISHGTLDITLSLIRKRYCLKHITFHNIPSIFHCWNPIPILEFKPIQRNFTAVPVPKPNHVFDFWKFWNWMLLCTSGPVSLKERLLYFSK